MGSIKIKIKSFYQKLQLVWSFFSFFRQAKTNQKDLDRKLVYDLSPRKIPSGRQIKYLKRFLNPRESLVIKIAVLILVVNLIYLGTVFVKNHLQVYPTRGGNYIEGVVDYPQTINPLYAVNPGIDQDLSYLIYSSLFKYDGKGRLSNDLVQSVTVNASGTKYIIKIRNNVYWQNGDKLSTADVIFTLNLIQNPAYHSPLRLPLSKVIAHKINDQTLEFVLPKPYAPFLDLLTFGILPKKIWENIGPKAILLSDLNLRPIGSGPFKFNTLVKNKSGDLKSYQLIVNKNYYGRIPYLKTITFKFFPVYQEAIKALNDHQIMGLNYLPFVLRGNLLATDSLNLHELVQSKIVALFFNYQKNKSLDKKTVRVALAESLNRPQIIKDVFAGTYQLGNGPILSENFAYNKNLIKYNYLPVAAAKTIKAHPLSVVLTVINSGDDVLVAEHIKSYWEKVGIKVQLKIISSDQAAKVIKNRDFEILLYGEAVGGDPDLYAFWDSSQVGSQGLNLSNYSNPAVDKLLVTARSTVNLTERIAKYKEFQKIITNDLPAIFLYSPSYTYPQSSTLKGFLGMMIINPADRFSSISNWYLNTKEKLKW